MKVVFDQAPKELKEIRRKICDGCDRKRDKFKIFGVTFCKRPQCVVCLCDIELKTSIKVASCPLEKW